MAAEVRRAIVGLVTGGLLAWAVLSFAGGLGPAPRDSGIRVDPALVEVSHVG